MSLSVFYYCICAFFCHCRKFELSLSPFLLFYVTVSTSCLLSEFYHNGTSWNCMYLNKIPCATHTHFKVQDNLQPFLTIVPLILIQIIPLFDFSIENCFTFQVCMSSFPITITSWQFWTEFRKHTCYQVLTIIL